MVPVFVGSNPITHPMKKALAKASAFFNEINPVGICEITAMRYEIADAMKCAAAHRGFILFHILP